MPSPQYELLEHPQKAELSSSRSICVLFQRVYFACHYHHSHKQSHALWFTHIFFWKFSRWYTQKINELVNQSSHFQCVRSVWDEKKWKGKGKSKKSKTQEEKSGSSKEETGKEKLSEFCASMSDHRGWRQWWGVCALSGWNHRSVSPALQLSLEPALACRSYVDVHSPPICVVTPHRLACGSAFWATAAFSSCARMRAGGEWGYWEC